MKKKRIHIVLFLLFVSGISSVTAQQSTLIGHQDLAGYFNPALITGSNGQISYLYRYQWEGLGPSSNTLFFKYPLKSMGKLFKPHSIGTFFQYEDFDIIGRAKLEFFASNTIARTDHLSFGLGVNAGLSYVDINTNEFNAAELVDPELSNVNRRLSFTNKLGFLISHRIVDVGLAARFLNAELISDYHSSFFFKVPIPNSSFRFNPMAVVRMTESFDYQWEAQLKTTYEEKVSLTVGYREGFGAVFQLAFRINESVKASYGIETPNDGVSAFGMTHELYGSYSFESPAIVQHRKDSIIKVRRDSLNKARIERYKRLREEEMAKRDSLAEAEKTVVEEETGSEEEPVDIPTLRQATPDGEIYSSLDDLIGNASDNTHVILDHIGFEPGLYLLTPDSYVELDKLFNYIRHHKSLHIEIQGHTDNSGSPETNLDLSRYRALAVFNYLVSKGIDPARMNVVGYGENQPLYPNDTKENRELNRRIEIVFIKR